MTTEVVAEAEEDAAAEALKTVAVVEAEAALTAAVAAVSANGTDLSAAAADSGEEARRPVEAVASAALTRPMTMTTILTCRILLPTMILTHRRPPSAAITAAEEVIITVVGTTLTAEGPLKTAEAEVR